MLAIIIALTLGSHVVDAQQTSTIPKREEKVQPKDENSEEFVIRALQSALGNQRIAIRIYLHSTCQTNLSEGISFPAIDIQLPASGEGGLVGVRDIFRNDKNVNVTQDGSGVIRIVIGNVFTSILNAELASVHLNKTARYNPDGPAGAIDLIESEPPVEIAMHHLRVSRQPVFYIGPVTPPLPNLPHLPSSLRDMTVDQSLDLIAKTFAGFVVYGECEDVDGGHRVDIRFDWFKQTSPEHLQGRTFPEISPAVASLASRYLQAVEKSFSFPATDRREDLIFVGHSRGHLSSWRVIVVAGSTKPHVVWDSFGLNDPYLNVTGLSFINVEADGSNAYTVALRGCAPHECADGRLGFAVYASHSQRAYRSHVLAKDDGTYDVTFYPKAGMPEDYRAELVRMMCSDSGISKPSALPLECSDK